MKKAIIVGASSGIGNELAKILVENGYEVGITGRRKPELEKIRESRPESYVISSFDCTTENNTEKLTDLTNKLGGLDLLILSSGTGDLNEKLNYEIENKTNLLNVNAFTEIVDWTFNYYFDSVYPKPSTHLIRAFSVPKPAPFTIFDFSCSWIRVRDHCIAKMRDSSSPSEERHFKSIYLCKHSLD